MKRLTVALWTTMTLLGAYSQADAQILGAAQSFSVLAGNKVTNLGFSTLWGNFGMWRTSNYSPSGAGITTHGGIHMGDLLANQAAFDVINAYNKLGDESYDMDFSGMGLGGMTLYAGVYQSFDPMAFLDGTLTLDARGDPNAQFIFLIDDNMQVASNSSVNIINGGSGVNVYWRVRGRASLGVRSDFAGNVLAMNSIDVRKGARISSGSLLTIKGNIALNSNTIGTADPLAVPEPMTMGLMAVAALAAYRRIRTAPISA